MIGKRIKEFRKSLGLTQTEFAKKLGMTMQGVQKWEKDDELKIKESSLRLIESTFGVSPLWLREGKGEVFLLDESIDKTNKQLALKRLTDIPESKIIEYLKRYLDRAHILEEDGKQEDTIIAVFRLLTAEGKLDVMKFMDYQFALLSQKGSQGKSKKAQ